ncbi:hypothetical protein GCM10011352_35890 [Marinobacterium zhoushanense]|uniref:DUF2889 domain-containing protein n=1 Tax=Marinobacterium zhoushanense TaxID=1679163 RepID=A0ABQ1KSH8_9GAMM|nr:DUF2889 domain-containing protein [Marinobacterium zhoushanense]GGC06499.1 hypothetical protein GCM10011352_35890 [Marinobacterium zhoushanense]
MNDAVTPVKRTPLHKRSIEVQGYLRDDGLWEVEGALVDTKGYDIDLPDRGRIPVGGYLHNMTLTLTVDDRLKIVDARAAIADSPYQDCPMAAQQYAALIGLTIRSGWMEEAKKAIGRVTGCTHLTELLPVLATAAIQTIRGYHLQNTEGFNRSDKEKTMVQNTCFGFRDGGRAQRLLWPEEGQIPAANAALSEESSG